jgi:hypothetical protein
MERFGGFGLIMADRPTVRGSVADFEIELYYFFRLRLILLLETFVVPRPNATRFPSIADEVATDLVTVLSRTAGLRR